MPYEVAKRHAKDSLQSSQFKLGTENIAIIDGKSNGSSHLHQMVLS